MYQRNNKHKKKVKCVRLLAGVLAAALTVSVPYPGILDIVSGAQLKEDPALPAGGMMEFVTEQVESVCTDVTDGKHELRSVQPELCRNDWDCYSNDYYYSKLSAKEQQLYERLDAACGELLTSAKVSASSYKVKVTDTKGTKTLTRRGTKMVSTLGLSREQVKKVQTLFIYANPQYYFLNTTLLENTKENTCALGMYEAFADGGSRAEVTEDLLARLDAWQETIVDNGCTYKTEVQIHELICDELSYMSGDVLSDKTDPYYTQTIYGALVKGETVCAGYTKLYAALCNYFGIDCIAVSSEDHAWNEVRYGAHWYIVDVTWDDTKDRTRFFHITDRRMTAVDQNRSHVPYSYYEGIRPVADAEFAQELKTMTGLNQPRVELKDTAAGVSIAMTADGGNIYYTLDGTDPGVNDLYTTPIELTDGGIYIVTAVAADEGSISSAYEIFPVRIAGGKVSITAAKNVSGRQIKVKFQSAKKYSGYEISYASKRDFRNAKSVRFADADIASRTVLISGLKKGKIYYIRVRGYKVDAYGDYYYTPYSEMKKVTITR